MYRSILLIIAILFAGYLNAQKTADSLFKAGCDSFANRNFGSAIGSFKAVVLNFKKAQYYNQAVYNLAYSYNSADSDAQAEYWYEVIRASDVKDDDPVGGRGILEPFSNYKHYSTFNIGNIEYNKGNYAKALDYYSQSESKYPYHNESGTDIRITKNRIRIFMTDCLMKMDSPERALMTILPEVLDSYGSPNYSSVVKRCLSVIDKNFDRKSILHELEQAIKTIKKNEGCFEMSWRNSSVKLYPYGIHRSDSAKDLIENIKGSDFWTQLTK